MNAAHPGSVLASGRKWWATGPAEHTAADVERAHRAGVAFGVGAARDEDYRNSWRPLLARNSRPAYLEAAVPGWAREQYAAELRDGGGRR